MTTDKFVWRKRLSTRESRMAAGICAAFLMAATALGQSNEKANVAAPLHPAPAAVKKRYLPASVHASPGSQCKLYPTGAAPSAGLAVFTDDDGYARFHAVRAAAGDAVQQLTLACTNPAGMHSSYAVDLMSDDTFAPRPVNLAKERGTDRPALRGDPLSYTEPQLIQGGYGLRPDPKKDAAAYARWLAAASRPGRILEAKRPNMNQRNGPSSTTGGPWVGATLTGAPTYISTEAIFDVPTAIPGGDNTTSTEIAVWNGLGGYGTGSGLIQSGVSLQTTPSTAAYGSWREYCCGDKDNNMRNGAWYGSRFTPSPGDQIFAEEWYCDSEGNRDINGGYGCLHMDTTPVMICVSASDRRPALAGGFSTLWLW
jgi:hypothetical protein